MKRTRKNLSLLLAGIIALSVVTLSSCKKNSSDPTLPQIGGYNSSDEVAATNLKAHWGFEGNANEAISSTGPSTSLRSSYVTGIRGQALKLDSGYLLYPTIAALNINFGSITVSAWINTDNQGTGSATTSIFSLPLAGAAEVDWNRGPVAMYLENGRPKAYDDTLVLHSNISTYIAGTWYNADNINDYSGVRETDYKTVHGTNKWVHYVLVYDGSASNLDIYANGVLVSNGIYRHRQYGVPPVDLGMLNLPSLSAQTQVLIGAYPNSSTGFSGSLVQSWQGLYRGSIDEIRVYNKALNSTEITALYQLELAGR